MAEPDRYALDAEDEETYILLAQCAPDTRRPCEVLITYAQLEALAVEAGADPSALHAALGRGAVTEREARQAAEATARSLPPDQRAVADAWIGACWGEGGA